MNKIVKDFFEQVALKKTEIYNEFSLQHELGIFLRNTFEDKKVQFERNVSYFNLDKSKFEKREIDISIFSDQNNLDMVLELKYPRNGQVPESLFSFCKDIVFLEQLKKSGFKKAYFLAVADDKIFYEGKTIGIYKFFRAMEPITGNIIKPTGSKDKTLKISGSYIAKWNKVVGDMKYCLIEITS